MDGNARKLRGRVHASIAFAIVLVLAGGRAYATNYVFATFKGDMKPQEALSTYGSSDALSFKLVSDTGFSGPSGALRDPSIMKYADGKYYVAYTDPLGAGCCGKEDHFSIASSTDLVHWTNLTMVIAGVPGVAHVWAPEWFVEGSTVAVIANIDTLNTDSDFKPYIFTALNNSLTSWSGPVAMGIGPNYIDTFALKVASTYHVFAKNESTRFVEHATASKLTGPWTFVGKGNWAGWGSGMEGPNLVRLDDGTWRIYLDGQGSVGFLYSNTSDLISWSATAPLPGITGVVRHGTIIRDEPVGGGNIGGTGGGIGQGGVSGSGGIAGVPGAGGGGGRTSTGGGPGGAAGGAGRSGTGGAVGGNAGAGGSKVDPSGVGGASGTGGLASGGGGGTFGDGGFSGKGGAPVTGGSPGRDAAIDTDASSRSHDASPANEPSSAENAGCACGVAGQVSSPDRWLGCLLGCLLLCCGRRPTPGPGRTRRYPTRV